jgi:hypothetical protein
MTIKNEPDIYELSQMAQKAASANTSFFFHFTVYLGPLKKRPESET